MGRILIVDDMAVVREPIAAALAGAGFEITSAASGREALAKLKASPQDLVLLDLSMPEMDGLAVLTVMREDPATAKMPVILLTASGDKTHILQAAKLGVRDYVLKSRFALSDLVARIQKYLAPAADQSKPAASKTNSSSSPIEDDNQIIRNAASAAGVALLTRGHMVQRLDRAKMKTLPGAVADLMGLIGSPRGGVLDIAQALKRDPILSMRVLRMANSAAFASERARTTTVEDAVKSIGVAGVRNMLMSVGVFETSTAGQSGPQAADIIRCWQHSLAVAALMEKLTPQSDQVASGAAYLVGLCHDLADIILRQYFFEEYRQVLTLMDRTGKPRQEVLSVVFGQPYEELITMLLTRIGLPALITTPIQEFFEKPPFRRSQSVLARILRIANFYAHGLMLAASADKTVTPLGVDECRSLLGSEPPVIDDVELRSQVMMTAGILAGSSSDASKASEPLVPASERRVCYARHESYSDFDPLHTLLRLTTTHVELRSHLPGSAVDLDGIDALIVARPLIEASEATKDIQKISALLAERSIPVLYLDPRGAATRLHQPPTSIVLHPLPVSLKHVTEFLSLSTVKQSRAA